MDEVEIRILNDLFLAYKYYLRTKNLKQWNLAMEEYKNRYIGVELYNDIAWIFIMLVIRQTGKRRELSNDPTDGTQCPDKKS